MDENYTTIKERVLLFAKNQGIAIETFLSSIGMTYGSFKGKAKKGSLNSDAIVEISTKYPTISLTWLLTGDGDMLSTPGSDRASSKAVPYWDLPVSAGHSVIDIIGEKNPAGYIQGLPGIDIAENILPVTGMSMEPEISNGAIIGVRKTDNWETLNTERIYLIITRDDRMVKRIEPDNENDNILWCISPNYHKFKIYKEDIIEIQRVCFVYNPK